MGIKNWRSSAGRKGGLARVRLFGNPGTREGRRLGGLNSQKTHRASDTGFKTLRRISFPRPSTDLAELFGILAGDGHVGEYQTTVSTSSVTDSEHARHAAALFESLFGVAAPIKFNKGRNVCVVVVSSKEVGRFLVHRGLIKGNKVHAGLRMPEWIASRETFKRAFTRGLFDTDGCVYVDKHLIKGRTYRNLGIAFTNYSSPLLADFKSILESIGLHPTQKTKNVVFLRREKEIRRYFELVGSSNPKHLKKVNDYFSQKGGVPKRS